MSADDTKEIEASPPTDDGRGDLRARYGAHLAGMDLSAAQETALLESLWAIICAVIDLGLSVKPGENFAPKGDIGMDDVLDWIMSAEDLSASAPSKKPTRMRKPSHELIPYAET